MCRIISGNSGFTYLTLMFSIVIIGIGLSVIGPSWKTAKKIEKEEELLFRGKEIVDAIAAFYNGLPGQKAFPSRLEDLLKDPRYPTTKRYLRKIYKDPITNSDWIFISDANQRIRGVKSKSDEEPLKKANFPDEFKGFEGKKKYSDWVFEYIPETQAVPKAVTPQSTPNK